MPEPLVSRDRRSSRRRPGRREDVRLVTGQGTYVTGQRRADQLYAGFVRSYLAHGRVLDVGLAGALDHPEVYAAYDAAALDLSDIPGRTGAGRAPEAEGMGRPPLARDRVRYVGEPVAVVVARSRAGLADALERVELELDPLPAVVDPAEALRDEVLLHPAAGSNIVGRSSLGADRSDADLDRWPIQIDIEVENGRLAPVPLEPLSMLAELDGEQLVVRCGHQAPHRFRDQLAAQLGIEQARIRVVSPDTGGAFGMRGMLFPEQVVVAALARELRRPIHWTETRTEQFQGGTHGRSMRHRVRLAGDADGRIHAAEIDLVADVGAYPHNGSHVPGFTAFMAPGNYAIEQVAVTTTQVVTNRAPTGSYRGAGRPEATYAIERAIETFGVAAGLDPVEVRRHNVVPAAAMPYRSATGALYDSGDYTAALDRLVELVDIPAVRERQRRRRDDGGPAIGVGFAMFVERAGGAPTSSEYGRVEVGDDGRVRVRVGTAASGQGHETVWSRLAADLLGVPDDEVEIIAGDTAEVADGTGTFASRSAQVAGAVVHRCSERVRQEILRLGEELLEVDRADLTLTRGRVEVAGAPDRGTDLADLVRVAADRGYALADEETYSPGAQTFPYGATAAIVEVDLETGRVVLLRLVAVDDCGTVLDPTIVEGQVHGSLVQGIGQALYEGIVYDEAGQLITATLMDYLVPGAPDLPDLETDRLEHPAPSNPLGVKGAGESGCLGAPPAIVHAVLDALRPYGVRDLSMPITPQQVWQALQPQPGAAATEGTQP